MATERPDYDNFDGFLNAAIQQYWERGNKMTFIALLLATREAWAVAADKTLSAETGAKLLKGAAGVAGVTVLLRIFLGGPIGILLTGASVVSLAAVYAKNHERIWKKQLRIRELLKTYREEFDKVDRSYREGTFQLDQRDLMVDGLIGRFLGELDDGPEDKPAPKKPKEPEMGSFAAHVKAHRQDEDGA